MTALDTDVLSLSLKRHPPTAARVAAIPPPDVGLPVVVVEEVFRGRLATIRLAQAGRAPVPLERAYELFAEAVDAIRPFRILPYTPQADALYQQWRKTIRIGARDLRIAAICVSLSVILATRNAQDFSKVPGLALDIWP